MDPDVAPTPPPVPDAAPKPTPGEVVRPAQRALERPPSERYAADAEAASPRRGSLPLALVGALVPAAFGCGLLVLLASPLAVSEPLVVVAVLVGLAAGLGARFGGGDVVPVRRRRRIALGAALAAVAVAEVIVWQLALGEGGVLAFFDYQWVVFGPVAALQPIAALLAARSAA
jgi:hypothetical protein